MHSIFYSIISTSGNELSLFLRTFHWLMCSQRSLIQWTDEILIRKRERQFYQSSLRHFWELNENLCVSSVALGHKYDIFNVFINCVLMVQLIKRKIRHSRVLCWPDPHKSFTSSHIVEWKIWESSSQSMISSCRPVVFLFWGYPSLRAGMSPLFHCAGNTEGRKEVAYWF